MSGSAFGKWVAVALAVLGAASPSAAQFGKNKVQYGKFEWRVVRTTHFDIHFAQGGDLLAHRAADSLESFYARLVERTGMRLEERVPLIIYNSHPKFQQTNVIDEILEEGIGGFTEIFKNRIAVPFEGSYRQFDHVLAHEMVHAVMFESMRQGAGSALAGAISTRMPLWFSEGLAEYVSLDWDRASEMWLIDAVTAGYLPMPTGEIQGFLAYRAGQNFLFYLDRTFGPGTVRKIVQRTLRDRDFERAILSVTRVGLRDLGEEWIRELRWAYWPELGKREHGSKAGRKLTKAGEDGSYWNMQAALSPDGSRVAWFSDRGTRQGLYVGELEQLPRKEPRRLHQGGGTPSHESFSPFRSGLAWSPDGKRIVVAAQSGGRNVLSILDVRKGSVVRTVDPKLDALSSPEWSPDGKRLVFRGLLAGQADLWSWNLESDSLSRLTDDLPDDDKPTFSPSGRYLAWSSESDGTGIGARRSIWLLDLRDGSRRMVSSSTGDETDPSFGGASDDSARLAFLSDRSGIPQVYVAERPFDAAPAVRPLTNLLAGVQCPKLSKDGTRLVLSLFEGGAFDVYDVDAARRLPDSVLAPTRFVETSAAGAPELFRPLVRENMESFRFDTLDLADSAKRAKDSLDRARRDSLKSAGKPPKSPDEAGSSRLFGFERDEDAARRPPPRRPARDSAASDTLEAFPKNLPLRDSAGRPLSEPYRTRWGLDNAALAFGFSTWSGTAGQGMFTFSDLMGDQIVQAMLNVQGSFEDANVFLRYGYLPYQTDFYASVYHTRTFTGNLLSTGVGDSSLFADRLYGVEASAIHPLSMFHRVGAGIDFGGIQRKVQAWDEDGNIVDAPAGQPGGQDLAWVRANAEWVFDNVLWGPTGPWDGWRAKLSASALPPWIQGRYGFGKAKADLRGYFPTGRLYGFALRVSAGQSFGLGGDENPYRFLVGGEDFTFNYHLNESNSGTDVSSMYFSELDLPLRGYRYYQFRGTKEIVANAEFRFPFVEELRFGIFLPTIRYLMGAVFVDAGTAWTSHRMEDQGGIGMGWGVRMNLGAFVLKWSKAWPLTQPSGAPGNVQPRNFVDGVHYWSLGADF